MRGTIQADVPDVEKIHIINLNLEKGAVTNDKGNFQIPAKENDSLYISSIQFENITLVVTPEMIRENNLVIKLQPRMNELAEVVIDDIRLSGYLGNDIGKIAITEAETRNQLQHDLNIFIEKDKKVNTYGKPNPTGGINVKNIAGVVIDKLSKNADVPINYSPKELANKSIRIVGHEFFREDLNLNENEICNFVYFCTKDIRFKRLVLNSNALVLIEYFETKIADFRDLRGSALNLGIEIPG